MVLVFFLLQSSKFHNKKRYTHTQKKKTRLLFTTESHLYFSLHEFYLPSVIFADATSSSNKTSEEN